jgi:hypothetical protein
MPDFAGHTSNHPAFKLQTERFKKCLSDQQFPEHGDVATMRAYVRQHSETYSLSEAKTFNSEWSNYCKLKS